MPFSQIIPPSPSLTESKSVLYICVSFAVSSCYHLSKFHIYALILEKAMTPDSSNFAWKIPWMEEPGRLRCMESLRVGHE